MPYVLDPIGREFCSHHFVQLRAHSENFTNRCVVELTPSLAIDVRSTHRPAGQIVRQIREEIHCSTGLAAGTQHGHGTRSNLCRCRRNLCKRNDSLGGLIVNLADREQDVKNAIDTTRRGRLRRKQAQRGDNA
ncbi:hypothetical protein GA0061091_12437 [Gordonia sp. v-85]|nr:hypothetical protein GA0061091_12437 [Gordonia sp. v-85]